MGENKIFEEELPKRLKTVLGDNAVWGSIRVNDGKINITSYTDDKYKQIMLLSMAITQNIAFSLNIDPNEFMKELLRIAKEEKKNG